MQAETRGPRSLLTRLRSSDYCMQKRSHLKIRHCVTPVSSFAVLRTRVAVSVCCIVKENQSYMAVANVVVPYERTLYGSDCATEVGLLPIKSLDRRSVISPVALIEIQLLLCEYGINWLLRVIH
ncbi:hypothetical protein TNCV_3024931 [Trichonephila clavipes]|nr:hypothetical protein TNCV_3024931 [Trichonephila clavipes]